MEIEKAVTGFLRDFERIANALESLVELQAGEPLALPSVKHAVDASEICGSDGIISYGNAANPVRADATRITSATVTDKLTPVPLDAAAKKKAETAAKAKATRAANKAKKAAAALLADVEASPEVTPVDPSEPEVVTKDEVVVALSGAVARHNKDAGPARGVLLEFGCDRISKLDPANYAACIEKLAGI